MLNRQWFPLFYNTNQFFLILFSTWFIFPKNEKGNIVLDMPLAGI